MLQSLVHKVLINYVDAEATHDIALNALKLGFFPKADLGICRDKSLNINLWGKTFPNPLGIAAGFDKNGEVIGPLMNLGFGFVEVGTITPRPQFGNPKPRVFRMNEDFSVFNSLGFNNKGMENAKKKIIKWKDGKHFDKNGLLGINIGPNKENKDRLGDYLSLIKELGGLGDYIVLNISSPNTPNLRDFHSKDYLAELLKNARSLYKGKLLIKLSPDETADSYKNIIETCLEFGVDGLIIGNTTQTIYHGITGGISGKLLSEIALNNLKLVSSINNGSVPIISTGGISNAEDAYMRIKAGATLIQAYTGMIYEGFGFAQNLLQGLSALLKQDGLTNIEEARGEGL